MKKASILAVVLLVSGCVTTDGRIIDDRAKYEWQRKNCGSDLGMLYVGMPEQRMKDCSHPSGYTPYVDNEWANVHGYYRVYTGGNYRITTKNGEVVSWRRTR